MRDWDLQVLFHFIRRPGMYTGSMKADDYSRIDSFLTAYEMGSMGECKFRDKLIEQIENKYDVKFPSAGLQEQLKIASKKAEQKIHEFFVNESMEILIKESDDGNKAKFFSQKRNQLINRLNDFSERINLNWVSNFSRELRELKAWKGINLSEIDMKCIEKLIDEINEFVKPNPFDSKLVPKRINNIRMEALQRLKEYER